MKTFFTLAVLATTAFTSFAFAKEMTSEQRNAELNDLKPNSLFCRVYTGGFDETKLEIRNGRKTGVVQIEHQGLTITVQSVGFYIAGEIKTADGTKLADISEHGGEIFSSHLFANGQKLSLNCSVSETKIDE